MMRWVGIDEAGYGPNLGPMVMTAVVAEGPDDRPPDVWADLPATIARAGGDPECLWIDDSKRIYRAGVGLDRLETASLAALAAAGRGLPTGLAGLLAALAAGTLDEAELTVWLGDLDPPLPRPATRPRLERTLERRPFAGAAWRITDIRTVVVGPARFNGLLEMTGSKAAVHFRAFARLLADLWGRAEDGVRTSVRSDKHGGRHFYFERLVEVFPDAWIDRGVEGPALSRYTLREGGRELGLCIEPGADAGDGLVALASMVSKAVRELWMEAFNAHWTGLVPGLRPTAGYPGDSARFRAVIEPHCQARGLGPELWWRTK